MLVVTMNQYLKLGLEALFSQVRMNNGVVFIPEGTETIYIYSSNNEIDEPLMLFTAVISTGVIIKYNRSETVEDIIHKISETFYNKRKGLSPREDEVLGILFQGGDYQEIAEKLYISAKTVCVHKDRALKKTGMKNIN